ncbi:MAG TPA: adenylate/guanylate cyclase domain-containing protein [Gemmatimonadota bacterium]|nr:adenylate/guanylate cyclase domain-containing protein [Gemmatimonadota bacterium]
MTVHRRLAALFFADIVDFSGLSARDEAEALRLVPLFQAAAREAVGRFGGRIVKFLGDGVIAEFPSTGNAIGAAAGLMETFVRDSASPPTEAPALRIGVHVGDVAITDDGDVFGDGVNTTARLCEAAAPGRILASEDVYRQLKQRKEFSFAPRADRELQGVGSVGTYEVTVIGRVEPDRRVFRIASSGGPRAWLRTPRARLAAGVGILALGAAMWATRGTWTSWLAADPAESAELDPSRLAVLYFSDQSETGDLGHLADGFTETLIHELTGVEGLKVVSQYGVRPFEGGDIPIDSVARALAAGTIIDGTVSRSGDSLRVQVQLLDATDMTQIASFTEVRPWSEMFSLQDEITSDVSTALRQWLGHEFDLRKRRRGTQSVEAWELLQRAERMSQQAIEGEESGVETAIRGAADSMLARAGELDPAWAEPAIARAELKLVVGTDEALSNGLDHVAFALEREPGNIAAFTLRGRLHNALARSAEDSTRAAQLLAAAERDLRTAVAGDPSYAAAWIALADLLYNDRWQLSEAREAARHAYEADVFLLEEDHFVWLCEISIQLEDREQARHWCAEGRRRYPGRERLVMTEIVRLASPGVEPDLAAGWSLVSELERLDFPEYNVPVAKMYTAAILVRAGLADSAAAVVADSRSGAPAEVLPFLDYIESYLRLTRQDRTSAIRLLRSFLVEMPEYRAILARDPWFEELRGDARFERLVDRVHLPIFCRILCQPPS